MAEAAATAARVVLVDDDALFRESLGQNLRDAGFMVTEFDGGSAAFDYFGRGEGADVILLDWKMPGMNGIELLRRLREAAVETPVIFLTMLSDQIYEEAALRSGAVDFVDKSRSFSILLKRVGLILDGVKGAPAETESPPRPGDEIFTLGPLELRLDTHRALWRGRQVDLSLTEFRMVRYLAGRPGGDVRYRELYDLVHGKDFVAGAGDEGYRANVRTFIKRIRQKFRDVDDGFEQIENYAGFGYRWRHDQTGR